MRILTATTDATKIVFSDVNLDVNIESPLELVYNEDSINKSIITILSTRKGSRVFRRNFGAVINDMLFEPIDNITADAIKYELIQAIKDWEDRIELQRAIVIPDYVNQQYYVQIDYIIPQLNNKSAQFTFNLTK